MACGLNALGVVVGAIEGNRITFTRIWPVALLVVLLALAWVREPRRIELARSALAAAQRSTGAAPT